MHFRPRHKPFHKLLTMFAGLVVCAVAGVFALSNHAFIYTPSMYPTIKPGSMVFIEPQKRYHVGEVIEFHANGLLWVHRLIAIKPNGDFVTKGDNPENKPDVFVPPTTSADVVGSVVMSVPYLGFPELIADHPSYGLGWLRAELGFGGRLVIVSMVGACAVLVLVSKKRKNADAGRPRGGGAEVEVLSGSGVGAAG